MKKRLTYLDKYVIFSILVLLVYAVFEFISPVPHDTLTACIFSAFGGEFLFCALIKIFKVKKGEDQS